MPASLLARRTPLGSTTTLTWNKMTTQHRMRDLINALTGGVGPTPRARQQLTMVVLLAAMTSVDAAPTVAPTMAPLCANAYDATVTALTQDTMLASVTSLFFCNVFPPGPGPGW